MQSQTKGYIVCSIPTQAANNGWDIFSRRVPYYIRFKKYKTSSYSNYRFEALNSFVLMQSDRSIYENQTTESRRVIKSDTTLSKSNTRRRIRRLLEQAAMREFPEVQITFEYNSIHLCNSSTS